MPVPETAADVIQLAAAGGRPATPAEPTTFPAVAGRKRAAAAADRHEVYCPAPGSAVTAGCYVSVVGLPTQPERTLVWLDGRRVASASTSRALAAALPLSEVADGPHALHSETLDQALSPLGPGSAADWEFTGGNGSAVATYTVPDQPARHTGRLPHFAADGSGVRTTYSPTLSKPILAMYQFDGAALANEGGASVFGAGGLGLTAVTQGWLASADLYGGGSTLAAYEAAWDGYFNGLAAMVPSGWLWLPASDDLVADGSRTLTQIDFYVNRTGVATWGPDYLGYALGRLKATGKVPTVLIGDEFGDTSRYPNVPINGSVGLAAIASAVRSAGLPQVWQVAVHTNTDAGWVQTYANGGTYGDGACCSWTIVPDRLYDGVRKSPGVYDARVSMRRTISQMAADRPRLVQVAVTGSFFRAADAGYAGVFRPGTDRLIQGPWPPAVILAQRGVCIIYGCSGTRYYEYDHAGSRANRARAYDPADPVPDRSYGLSPTATPTNWAVAAATNAWETARFKKLCQSPATLPAFGSDWEVGAWDGGSGNRLVLAVNGTDCRRAVPFVPSGTWTGGGTLTVSGSTVTLTNTAPTAGQVIPPAGWVWWEG